MCGVVLGLNFAPCLQHCSDQITSCLLKGLGFGVGSKEGIPMQVGMFGFLCVRVCVWANYLYTPTH